MATGNRTTSKPRDASAAKATTTASVAKATDRPYFNVMDNLNRALTDLRGTMQALYAVDTHIDDREDHEACRPALSRLLMADLGLVEEAQRTAWRVVVAQQDAAR
jgi:hypothetical protein